MPLPRYDIASTDDLRDAALRLTGTPADQAGTS
jgi:hypothetical protein